MKEQGRRYLWTGFSFVTVFAVWTALIKLVDVQDIGPMETAVGLATINGWFHKLTGVHMWLYTVTDWLGLIPVFVCLMFGGIGFVQLMQRKKLLKVDRDILLLGIYYLLVIFGYLVFEMIPINYRPTLIEGRLEASYPSSTTLLVLSVMPTLVFQTHRRLKNRKAKRIIDIMTVIFSLFMIIGRLVSGVHWLTDIIGSVLFSAGLFCIYRAVVLLYCKEE